MSDSTPAAQASDAPMAAISSGGGANYFLSIDGIPGESVDADHRDWIDVLSYSWGASSAAASAPTGGGRAGKSTATDLSVSTLLSQASPQLFLAVMTGKHAKIAVLEGVKQAGQDRPLLFMRLSLEDVLVRSYQTSAAQETPFDAFSLAYGRISYSYWRQNDDGTLGAEQVVSWDVKAAKSF